MSYRSLLAQAIGTGLGLMVLTLARPAVVAAQGGNQGAVSDLDRQAGDQGPPTESISMIAARLRRRAGEPDLRALLAASDAQPGLSLREVRRALRRSRLAALLPRLQVRGRGGRDLDRATDQTLDVDDQLGGDLELRWELSALVYGPDEVAWAREARSRERDREGRRRVLIAAYFERERLRLEVHLGARSDRASHLRIRELGALIDALTGGLLSRESREGRETH